MDYHAAAIGILLVFGTVLFADSLHHEFNLTVVVLLLLCMGGCSYLMETYKP